MLLIKLSFISTISNFHKILFNPIQSVLTKYFLILDIIMFLAEACFDGIIAKKEQKKIN